MRGENASQAVENMNSNYDSTREGLCFHEDIAQEIIPFVPVFGE